MPHKSFMVLAASMMAFGMQAQVHADDSALSGVGGSVRMMHEHASIRMVEEEVNITDLPKGHVKARFVFRNDGPATDILIGFPETGSANGGPPQYTDLKNFTSTVDGNRISVTRLADRRPSDSEDDYHIWWTKTVHFNAHQTHIITDEYTGQGGMNTTGLMWFKYVLVTGASWHGPIGRAVVTCDISGLKKLGPIKFLPAGYRRQGNLITWDIRNFEPTQDVYLYWLRGFVNVRVNGKYVAAYDNDQPGDPEHMGWNPEMWGVAYSERRGNDVWLAAKTAAAWLGATFRMVVPEKSVRLTKGNQWVEITVGSRQLKTSHGTVMMSSPAGYWRATDGSQHAYTMTLLGPAARALGGTANYHPTTERMDIAIH